MEGELKKREGFHRLLLLGHAPQSCSITQCLTQN